MLRVAAVQFLPTAERAVNLRRGAKLIEDACRAGAQVLFPHHHPVVHTHIYKHSPAET